MLDGTSALGTLAMVLALCWMLARMQNVLWGLALSKSWMLGASLMLEEQPRTLKGTLEGMLSKSQTLPGALAKSETLGVYTGLGVLRKLLTALQSLGESAWVESWMMRGALT